VLVRPDGPQHRNPSDMIPFKASSPARSHCASGNKRRRESDDDSIEDTSPQRDNKKPSRAIPDELPSEVVQRLVSFLLVSVKDPTDSDSTQTMRANLLAIARLSLVNARWRHALSDVMDAQCASYVRPFVLQHHEPRSYPIDSDEDGRPQSPLPAVFAGMDTEHLASAVRNLLQHLLHTDRSHFVGAMAVRTLLQAAAKLAQTPGITPDDRDGMQRLPLTVLAFAFQQGLSSDPRRFSDIVLLLVAHWNRYPIDVQVRMNEDLESLDKNGHAANDCVKKAWRAALTTELLEAVKVRRKRLDDLNTRSTRDARGARLYALKEMTSPPWYPSSPTRILTLSWIARHWESLSCLDDRVQQRQAELEAKVLDLFNEVARNTLARTCAEFLREAFPAPLRKLVLERMDRKPRKALLRGIDHEADT
jgi:hypothetical protein